MLIEPKQSIQTISTHQLCNSQSSRINAVHEQSLIFRSLHHPFRCHKRYVNGGLLAVSKFGIPRENNDSLSDSGVYGEASCTSNLLARRSWIGAHALYLQEVITARVRP
jgi:hypothetical protein